MYSAPDQQSTQGIAVLRLVLISRKLIIFHYKLIEQNVEMELGAGLKHRILPSSPVLPQNYLTLELCSYELFDLLIMGSFFIVLALQQD